MPLGVMEYGFTLRSGDAAHLHDPYGQLDLPALPVLLVLRAMTPSTAYSTRPSREALGCCR
jgi:hypothetical protein